GGPGCRRSWRRHMSPTRSVGRISPGGRAMPKTALNGTSAVRKISVRDCTGPLVDCISATAELPAEKRRDQREPGQISYYRPGDGGDGDDDDRGHRHQRLPAAPAYE